MKQRYRLLALALMLSALPLQAQKKASTPDRISGLSLTVDAGLLIPNSKQAGFYSGSDENANTINRVLKSELYGNQIWQSLVERQLISPSAIPSYRDFTIAEEAHMYYRLTYQLGIGIRYDYPNNWAWQLRFDYSQVTAAGQFLLSSNNGTGILGSDQYVPCDIFGIEKRLFIDFAIARRIPLTQLLDLEPSIGIDLNNTKVTENAMRIAGKTYSILDVWHGQYPYTGIGTEPYINQGGIGLGGFAALAVCYKMRGYSIDAGYCCSYVQTKYLGYNEEDCFALQHNIFFRFNINNFRFLN